MTLNPLKHLDPFLSVILPVVMFLATGVVFGGGKPVPVVPSYFRNPSRDFMFVALAGPGSNLVLAFLAALLFAVGAWAGWIPPVAVDVGFGDVRYAAATLEHAAEGGFLARTLYWGVLLNALLAAFNLIPLPPLDGSRVMGWLLPMSLKRLWYGLDRFGLLMLIAFLYLFEGWRVLFMVFEPVYNFYSTMVADLVDVFPPA